MENLSNSLGKDAMNNKPNGSGTLMTDAITNIISRHLKAFQRHDMESLLSDYTNESVFITPNATYTGIQEIRSFFVNLMLHFPQERSRFELDKLVVNGKMAFIVWHANTPTLEVPLGTDTFFIKDGKIHQQTFAGLLNFLT
jgi:hypothetical protein